MTSIGPSIDGLAILLFLAFLAGWVLAKLTERPAPVVAPVSLAQRLGRAWQRACRFGETFGPNLQSRFTMARRVPPADKHDRT